MYSKNWRNSVALNLEKTSRDLGRLAKSEGQYDFKIFNLSHIIEIDLPESFDKREYLPWIHAVKSFFTTPRHTRCMYSKGTCETILIGSDVMDFYHLCGDTHLNI